MNTPDDHDTRKARIESEMITQSEDKANVATFGKVAYEAHRDYQPWGGIAWGNLSRDVQCAWVAAAQAVLDEARRVGWI